MQKLRLPVVACSIFLCSAQFTIGICAQPAPTFGSHAVLNPVTPLSAASFANPPSIDWPWARIALTPDASPAELRREISELHRSGIGGIEIGQGSYPSSGQLIAILQSANQLGIKVSLSHGPTVSPAGYSLNETNARKTLLFASANVHGGSSAQIAMLAPAPPRATSFGPPGPPTAPHPTTLVAVFAYKCTHPQCGTDKPTELDPQSAIDLASSVSAKGTNAVLSDSKAGDLQWTAPAGGDWLVVSFWSQPVYPQPDLFSREGTDDLIHGMDESWPQEVKLLLKQNGGDIFYDSHSVDRGRPSELWTNKMEAEFKARRGYSLLAHAPALFDNDFVFSDGSAPRIRNDLNAVRTDLWIENHLRPLAAWAHALNLKIRLQPYGEPASTTPDEILAATALDRPENESLYMGDEVDSYLPIASANHMDRNSWYSFECCAALGMNYAQTFQDLVIRMHRGYAGGITRLVYHFYPYRDAPDAKWPGYSLFGPAQFANAWGPRNPIWTDAHTYNSYLARTQQVLTQGDARVDVAVYLQSYLFPAPMFVKGGFRFWTDTGLQRAGYTRDYLDPELLNSSQANVRNGRLATDRAAYKALIIDSEQKPATDPVKTSMPLNAARQILAFAQAGLPIVIVGQGPDQTPGNSSHDDAALRSIMDQLVVLPNAHQVAHESDVPALLQSLSIHPSMEPSQPSPLLSVRRKDAARRVDYYFLYNQGVVTPPGEPGNLFEPAQGSPFDQEIRFEGVGTPYRMDAWSGQITPIADYTSGNGTVALHLKIAPDDATIIAISPTPFSSDSSAVRRPPKQDIAPSPQLAALDLTHRSWHLSVEDWQPAQGYATTGPSAAETRKELLQLEIDQLKPWPEIPELKNVSGVGTYTIALDLPSAWKSGGGARLILGEVFDSFTLQVNGEPIPANQISAEAEIGNFLHAGRNSIAIRVATTLNNRLASLDADVAKRGLLQRYGLVGPVMLIPHQ